MKISLILHHLVYPSQVRVTLKMSFPAKTKDAARKKGAQPPTKKKERKAAARALSRGVLRNRATSLFRTDPTQHTGAIIQLRIAVKISRVLKVLSHKMWLITHFTSTAIPGVETTTTLADREQPVAETEN